MSNASQQIVNKAWNFAHVLRDDGLSYMAYTEQITFPLFLKMADEQTRAPHFTLKTNTLKRADLDDFVACYDPENRHERTPTWHEEVTPPPSPLPQGEGKTEGRWRAFNYEELLKRDKLNLDIFWLRDKGLEDSENLPEPAILAQEIADDLQTALDQFSAIAAELRRQD